MTGGGKFFFFFRSGRRPLRCYIWQCGLDDGTAANAYTSNLPREKRKRAKWTTDSTTPDVGVVYERKGVDEMGEYACSRGLPRQASVESGSVFEGGHWAGPYRPACKLRRYLLEYVSMYIMVLCGVCRRKALLKTVAGKEDGFPSLCCRFFWPGEHGGALCIGVWFVLIE